MQLCEVPAAEHILGLLVNGGIPEELRRVV
jgi:hypothetical protein